MKKLRFKEDKLFAQGHMANKWPNWNRNFINCKYWFLISILHIADDKVHINSLNTFHFKYYH